jgi:hypothetical protein
MQRTPPNGIWSNPYSVGETHEDRMWREKGYERERQQAAADPDHQKYIVGDTEQYRIERERLYERERLEIAADKARAEALAWKETQARWLNEETAAKTANAEAEKRKQEWLDRYKAEDTRLKGTPEQQARHRRRVAESDAVWKAQQEAKKHHFHAHHPWPGY